MFLKVVEMCDVPRKRDEQKKIKIPLLHVLHIFLLLLLWPGCVTLSNGFVSYRGGLFDARRGAPTAVESIGHMDRDSLLLSTKQIRTMTTTMMMSTKKKQRTEGNFHRTLIFPPFDELMRYEYGEFVVSDTFEVPLNDDLLDSLRRPYYGTTTDIQNPPKFRVKLYPSGGGHIPISGKQGVGVYLQYIPESDDDGSSDVYRYFDTTFSLRFEKKGGHNYNAVDASPSSPWWKAGTRFVPLDYSSLNGSGQANDFGTILTETGQLSEFLGIPKSAHDGESSSILEGLEMNEKYYFMEFVDEIAEEEHRPAEKAAAVKLSLEVTIHNAGIQYSDKKGIVADLMMMNEGTNNYKNNNIKSNWFGIIWDVLQLRDPRSSSETKSAKKYDHSTNTSPSSFATPGSSSPLRVGNVIVPLLSTKAPKWIDRRLTLLVSSFFSSTVIGGDSSQLPSFMEKNKILFRKGVYPGIDYRIIRIINQSEKRKQNVTTDNNTNAEINGLAQPEDLFFHKSGVAYDVKPIYNLPPFMQRKWPVRINERDIPNILTPLQYNVITAIGAISASVGILVTFFVISLYTSLFFIPSKSMDPTLQVGDVLLVEKITPRLPLNSYRVGDVVLFRPPQALRDIVSANGGRLTDRDLFVKRVAAVPGDLVSVDEEGAVEVNGRPVTVGQRDLCDAEPLGLIRKYTKTGKTFVEKDHVMLLGDCSSVSVDGRVWGTIETKNIVGRPMVRTWPTTRMTTIPPLPKGVNE